MLLALQCRKSPPPPVRKLSPPPPRPRPPIPVCECAPLLGAEVRGAQGPLWLPLCQPAYPQAAPLAFWVSGLLCIAMWSMCLHSPPSNPPFPPAPALPGLSFLLQPQTPRARHVVVDTSLLCLSASSPREASSTRRRSTCSAATASSSRTALPTWAWHGKTRQR